MGYPGKNHKTYFVGSTLEANAIATHNCLNANNTNYRPALAVA
jgi:hypothetical protein